MNNELTPPQGNFILFQSEDGQVHVECLFESNTLWLTLTQIASLFSRDKSVISKHLKNIYAEGELVQNATVANYATVQTEGSRDVERNIEYYNLEAILAVGYRVRSPNLLDYRNSTMLSI